MLCGITGACLGDLVANPAERAPDGPAAGSAHDGRTSILPVPTPAERKLRAGYLQRLRELPGKTACEFFHFDAPAPSDLHLFYYLFPPLPEAVRDGEKMPLIVVLHHAGAESDPAKILSFHPESIGRWLEPEVRKAHPAYVVAPWSGGHHWEGGEWKTITPMLPEPTANAGMVLDLIHYLIATRAVDPARIYVVGQSMGGFGVWDLLSRQPELFAAGIAVCGGGDPAQAPTLAGIPIRAFHGSGDTIIPVQRTRAMVQAITAIPGNKIRYREYVGLEHDACSERAFTEPALVDWLFRQHRPAGSCGGADPP